MQDWLHDVQSAHLFHLESQCSWTSSNINTALVTFIIQNVWWSSYFVINLRPKVSSETANQLRNGIPQIMSYHVGKSTNHRCAMGYKYRPKLY